MGNWLLDIGNILSQTEKGKRELKLNYREDNRFNENENIEVKYSLKRIDGGDILAQLETTLTPQLICDRCQDKFKKSFNINLDQIYSPRPQDDELPIDNGKIDIKKPIVRELITILPSKLICKDDCQGLCQICGANLNHLDCSCQTESKGHNEFQKLKNFKIDNNKDK
jgi:uncharacterized protein